MDVVLIMYDFKKQTAGSLDHIVPGLVLSFKPSLVQVVNFPVNQLL